MTVRTIVITAGFSLYIAGCSCDAQQSDRDRTVRTQRLIRELCTCIDNLTDVDRSTLLKEMVDGGRDRPNGQNAALLNYLNNRGLLGDVSLTRSTHLGDIAANGRIEFLDEWGHPLIVANRNAKTILVYLGNEKNGPIEVVVPAVNGRDVIIWSVGQDGVNQSGAGDDVFSW